MRIALTIAAYVLATVSGWVAHGYHTQMKQRRQRKWYTHDSRTYTLEFVQTQVGAAERALAKPLQPHVRRSIEGAHRYRTRELERISGKPIID